MVRTSMSTLARPVVMWRWTTRLARLKVVSVGERVIGVVALEPAEAVPKGILLIEVPK